MIIRKELEAIMSTPELWRSLHDLERAYTVRNDNADNNARYKAAFKVFKAQVEGSKGQIIPF